MKKTILFISLVLTSVFILAFVTIPKENKEIKITVTAEKQTTFDMFHNEKTTKGLKTPYEITISAADDRFIFKSQNLKTNLVVKAERANKNSVIGEWPIVVVVIDNDKMSTFGMD